MSELSEIRLGPLNTQGDLSLAAQELADKENEVIRAVLELAARQISWDDVIGKPEVFPPDLAAIPSGEVPSNSVLWVNIEDIPTNLEGFHLLEEVRNVVIARLEEGIDSHSLDETNVHGIPDTSLLETTSGAQTRADAAQLAAQVYADSLAAGAASDLGIHVADTSVHGIPDTTRLVSHDGSGNVNLGPGSLTGSVITADTIEVNSGAVFYSGVQFIEAVDAPFNILSPVKVDFLNADMVDGVHASDLVSALSLTESVQDIVGAMVADSTSLDATYNDATGTLSISVITEAIQDIIGALLTGTANQLTVTYNDVANTLVISLPSPMIVPGDLIAQVIRRNTSDGSDNGFIQLVGGGAAAASRGAYINFGGNESIYAGKIQLATGEAGTFEVYVGPGTAKRFEVLSNGVIMLGGATVATGAAAGDSVMRNASFLRGVNAGGTAALPLLSLDSSNRTVVDLNTALLVLTNALTALTVGAAGAGAALPATPNGYLRVLIGGTEQKIPYYAA